MLKNFLMLMGVMMFFIGASCLDSESQVFGFILAIIGLGIAFIAEKFFY